MVQRGGGGDAGAAGEDRTVLERFFVDHVCLVPATATGDSAVQAARDRQLTCGVLKRMTSVARRLQDVNRRTDPCACKVTGAMELRKVDSLPVAGVVTDELSSGVESTQSVGATAVKNLDEMTKLRIISLAVGQFL